MTGKAGIRIWLRDDGRYEARFQIGGQRKSVYGHSEREVRERLYVLLGTTAVDGGIAAPGRRTVEDLVEAYLSSVQPSLGVVTLELLEETFRGLVLPTLGKAKLARVGSEHIQAALNAIGKKHGPRSAQKAYSLLRSAFKLARRRRWLLHDPCDGVIRPKYKAARKAPWNEQELQRFLLGTRDVWLGPLFTLLAGSGCRVSEAVALRADDIDFDQGEIRIDERLARVKGKWHVGSPKTEAGNRVVPLPDWAVEALRRQLAWRERARAKAGQRWHDSGFVFCGLSGQPLGPAFVAKAMHREAVKLGLDPVSPHGLRHFHVSWLLAEGRPLAEVSERVGHSDPSVTHKVYTHNLRRGSRGSAKALDRIVDMETGK